MLYKNLKDYLERAERLLSNSDNVSLTYCALELRKAIELVVWTQFKDAFIEFTTSMPLIDKFHFRTGVQPQSISKMYEMLKRYSPNYVEFAQDKMVWTYRSSYGDAPTREDGKTCYIPGELPNTDYKYLSEILHYEKEFYPQKFKIEHSKLKQIFDRLNFIKDNYTLRLMPIKREKKQEILNDFKQKFDLGFET